MPATLPNTSTADTYPTGNGGAQLGAGDIFASGYFVVANAAVYAIFDHGARGLAAPSDEMFLPPATYPLYGTAKDPLGGIKFRSAVVGVPAQVFGVLYYPDEASLQAGSEFNAVVSPGGAVTPGSNVISGYINAAGGITQGTGFTVLKTGTGAYRITIAGSVGVSGLTASVVDSSPSSLGVVITRTSALVWNVFTMNAGAAFDRDFSFVAA